MEEAKPPVQTSVLIVSRNQVDDVRRTLASLTQVAAGGTVEVIIVDCASTDGSAAIDSEFPFVSILRMPKNFGWTKSVNVGTRTAAGEFLCLTPAGIEFAPDTLPQLVAAFEGDKSALAVAPLAVDAQGTPVVRHYPLPDGETIRQFWRTGSMGRPLPLNLQTERVAAAYVTNTALLLKRQSIVAMNYVDEKFGQFWADADIAAEIRRAGKSIAILPQVQVRGTPPYQQIPDRLDSWGALLSADAVAGGAAYLAKRSGFMAGFGFRLGAVFIALGSIFSFRQPGAQIKRFIAIASGQKIDGTQ